MHEASKSMTSQRSHGDISKVYNFKSSTCLVYAIARAINEHCVDENIRVDYCWLLECVKQELEKKNIFSVKDLDYSIDKAGKCITFCLDIDNPLVDGNSYVSVCTITHESLVEGHNEVQASINKRSGNRYLFESHEQAQRHSFGDKMCLLCKLNEDKKKYYFLYTYDDTHDTPFHCGIMNNRKMYNLNLTKVDTKVDQKF